MLDLGKIADIVLLMIDAYYGFEMETFEFLNILQTHGFPRVMGLLTHLDLFQRKKTMNRTKKILKHRFWTEVYQVGLQLRSSHWKHGRTISFVSIY